MINVGQTTTAVSFRTKEIDEVFESKKQLLRHMVLGGCCEEYGYGSEVGASISGKTNMEIAAIWLQCVFLRERVESNDRTESVGLQLGTLLIERWLLSIEPPWVEILTHKRSTWK